MKLLLAALLLTGCAAAPEPAYASKESTHRIEGFKGGVCSATAVAARTLLTAAHCVTKGQDVLILNGTLVGILRIELDGQDHALVVVTKTFAHVAKQGQPPRQGDRVHIYGNPGGYADLYREGVVAGTISGKLAIDLNSFFGDSGSGIWNQSGELVGVLSAIGVMQQGNVIAKLTIVYPLRFTSDQWASIV